MDDDHEDRPSKKPPERHDVVKKGEDKVNFISSADISANDSAMMVELSNACIASAAMKHVISLKHVAFSAKAPKWINITWAILIRSHYTRLGKSAHAKCSKIAQNCHQRKHN